MTSSETLEEVLLILRDAYACSARCVTSPSDRHRESLYYCSNTCTTTQVERCSPALTKRRISSCSRGAPSSRFRIRLNCCCNITWLLKNSLPGNLPKTQCV